MNLIFEKNIIKKFSKESLNSTHSNPKSIFIFLFSDIFIDIKSLFSLIFFLSENNFSPRLFPISLIVIIILIFSVFFITSKFIPSINNLHILISSLANTNSNFAKCIFIFTLEKNLDIFSLIGFPLNLSSSFFPLENL